VEKDLFKVLKINCIYSSYCTKVQTLTQFLFSPYSVKSPSKFSRIRLGKDLAKLIDDFMIWLRAQ